MVAPERKEQVDAGPHLYTLLVICLFYYFLWSDEIVEHLAEHGVTAEDFQC